MNSTAKSKTPTTKKPKKKPEPARKVVTLRERRMLAEMRHGIQQFIKPEPANKP